MNLHAWWRRVPTLTALSAACWWIPRPASVPLRTVWYRGAGPGSGDLVVFLPGRGDVPEDFEAKGLLADLRASGIASDVVAADAHMAYYLKETIVDRLAEDVVGPARAGGYDRIWLAGISLGGLGSLAFAKRHPDSVAGVLALAPYLGPRELADEIAGAGGLAAWSQGPDEGFRGLWLWLRGYATDPGGRPDLRLAYGAADRYAYGQRLLGGALAADHVLVLPGGHDWRTWRELWRAALRAGALVPRPSAASRAG